MTMYIIFDIYVASMYLDIYLMTCNCIACYNSILRIVSGGQGQFELPTLKNVPTDFIYTEVHLLIL